MVFTFLGGTIVVLASFSLFLSPVFGKTRGKKTQVTRKATTPTTLKNVREEYQHKKYRKAYRNLMPYYRHHPLDYDLLRNR